MTTPTGGQSGFGPADIVVNVYFLSRTPVQLQIPVAGFGRVPHLVAPAPASQFA